MKKLAFNYWFAHVAGEICFCIHFKYLSRSLQSVAWFDCVSNSHVQHMFIEMGIKAFAIHGLHLCCFSSFSPAMEDTPNKALTTRVLIRDFCLAVYAIFMKRRSLLEMSAVSSVWSANTTARWDFSFNVLYISVFYFWGKQKLGKKKDERKDFIVFASSLTAKKLTWRNHAPRPLMWPAF